MIVVALSIGNYTGNVSRVSRSLNVSYTKNTKYFYLIIVKTTISKYCVSSEHFHVLNVIKWSRDIKLYPGAHQIMTAYLICL